MAFGSGKKGVIKRARIADLLEAAKSMPDKAETKEDLTVGEMIPRLWPAIGKFMGKGYSYRDIATWMKDNGVDASEDTLVSAIGEEVRKRGKGRTAKTVENEESPKVKTPVVRQNGKAPAQAVQSPPMNGAGSKTDQDTDQPKKQPVPTASRTSAAFNEDV